MLSCLPAYSDASLTYVGETVTATGWGNTNHNGSESDRLMFADNIPVITSEECRKFYTNVPDTVGCIDTEQVDNIF